MIGRFLQRRRFMREHRWTHAHLSDYLDADLGPTERKRVHEHIGACPQCRRVLATLQRTLDGLRELGAPRRPRLATDVINRLRHQG